MALCSFRVRRLVLALLFIAGLLAGDAQAVAGGRLPKPVSAPNGTAPNGTAVGAAALPSKKGGVTVWAIASKTMAAELGTKLATKVKGLLGGKKVDRACGQVIASAVKTVADDYDVTVNSLKKEIGRLQKCRTQLDSVTKELIQCKSQSELNKCNIKLAAAQRSAKAAAQRLATCESDNSDLEDKVQELGDELESCTAGNDDQGTGNDTTDDNTDDNGTGDDTTDDNTDDDNTTDDDSTPTD